MSDDNPLTSVDNREIYIVVLKEDNYSIWPAHRPLPPDWIAVGMSGTKAECLAYIETAVNETRTSQRDYEYVAGTYTLRTIGSVRLPTSPKIRQPGASPSAPLLALQIQSGSITLRANRSYEFSLVRRGLETGGVPEQATESGSFLLRMRGITFTPSWDVRSAEVNYKTLTASRNLTIFMFDKP